MPEILFRVDADSQIGTGHLMRCLSLAEALADRGLTASFGCRNLPAGLLHLLDRSQHEYRALTDEEDAMQFLEQKRPHWVVIDHYALDEGFEAAARARGAKVLVIDDLANRRHETDMLLDQAPQREPSHYRPLVNSDCRLLLGPAFALLRPAFRLLRKADSKRWQHGLICFGGADPGGATLLTLQTIGQSRRLQRFDWTVISGSASRWHEDILRLVASLPRACRVERHVDDMAALMATQDFAIGAAGGMVLERACIGLPALNVVVAANQAASAEAIRACAIGEVMPEQTLQSAAQLEAALEQLRHHAGYYRNQGQRLVDGRGTERVVDAMLETSPC